MKVEVSTMFLNG